jgi:ribosomal protein L24
MPKFKEGDYVVLLDPSFEGLRGVVKEVLDQTTTSYMVKLEGVRYRACVLESRMELIDGN